MNMREHICVGPEVDKRQMLKRLVRLDEDRCMDDDAGLAVEKSICVRSVGSGDKSDKSHIDSRWRQIMMFGISSGRFVLGTVVMSR